MTRLRPIAALIALAATTGCGENTIAPEYQGALTASVNGAAWSGSFQPTLMNDALRIHSMRQLTEQHVDAVTVFSGPGSYTLRPDQVRYQETVGLDAVSYTAGGTGGTLVVQSYDPETGLIRGTLELSARGTKGDVELRGGAFAGRVRRVTP